MDESVEQLKAELLELKATLAAKNAAKQPRLKIPAPAKFTGNNSKVTAREWLRQLSNYLRSVDSSGMEVEMLANFLDEDAAKFFSTYLAGVSAGTYPALTSWDDFASVLLNHFDRGDKALTARQQLLDLKQGKKPVHEFSAEFTALVVHAPTMHEDDKVFQFCRGLHESIRTVQHPTTLVEAQRVAVAAEQGVHESKVAVAPATFASSSRSSGAAEPMELGLVSQLAALVVQKYGAEKGKGCFKCGSEAHTWRKCPRWAAEGMEVPKYFK